MPGPKKGTGGRPARWTPEQLAYLREHGAHTPVYYVAKEIGMLENTARWYLRKWGMQIIPRRQIWDPEDVQYLKDMVADMTVAEVAKALVRTEAAVRVKAHKLGLSVNQATRRPWTKFEDLFLYRSCEHMSIRKAGEHLNRSKMSVWARCQRLGIKSWVQGRRSCREVAEDLGCHPSYVRRLAKKAGIVLRATPGGGMMNITEDQYEALCAVAA
jgi:transposase